MIVEMILLSLMNLKLTKSIDIPILIKVLEETNANNIFSALKNRMREFSISLDEISFLSRHSFIKVSEEGEISFKEKIDLEVLCITKQICCGVLQCILELYIPMKNRKTNSLSDGVKLELEIIDKNDNLPTFINDKITLSISELTNIGTTFPLESAVDRDFSIINRVHKYNLVDTSNTNSFQIERSPSKDIRLKLLRGLDFELESGYNLTLMACDPDFCSNQTIHIEIKDENDNHPKFEKTSYNVTINETIGVGRIILTVKAVDLDRSKNYSLVHYKIDSKTIDQSVLNTFQVEELSGNIIVRRQLNSKTRSRYNLQIIARNGENFDTTSVHIFVEDENNCAPIIDILYPSNGQILIAENQSPQQVAILSITDNDVGINALTVCELTSNTENFILKSKARDVFTIHSAKEFNYEKQQNYVIQIRCRDLGLPSLTTISSLKISILDVNEYSPVFTNLHYRAYVRENTPPHVKLMQFKVNDEDKNATLTYRLDNETELALLKIDRNTGWISSTENIIDRETIQEFFIVIVVKDTLGEDAKSVSTTVYFQVEDQNDNRPQFVEKFDFKISENVPVNTLVGRVWATDLDEAGSSTLIYSLLKTWSSRQKEIINLFLVKSNGFIDTQGDIDRELDDNFTLLIAVSDGSVTRSPVTTNVTVLVNDENDNAPIWLVPSYENVAFNITINYKIGDQILQLVAKDPDSSINANVHYILSPNEADNYVSSKYFHVNATTGMVYVVNHLAEAKYRLKLDAIDSGRPAMKSSTILVIYAYGQESHVLKIAVVASMVAVTGIISFILIVSIICVRNQSIKRQSSAIQSHYYFDTDESISKLKLGGNIMQKSPDFLTLLSNNPSKSTVQIPMISSCHRHINEYVDADSADSGNGPSEEGLSSHYANNAKVFLRSMNQSGINYTSPNFIPSGLYPHSCFSLPENTTIPQFPDHILDGHTYYDVSSTNNGDFGGFLEKYPSVMVMKSDYPLQDLYSQLSQI